MRLRPVSHTWPTALNTRSLVALAGGMDSSMHATLDSLAQLCWISAQKGFRRHASHLRGCHCCGCDADLLGLALVLDELCLQQGSKFV
jgi:hypothetical protein